LVSGTIGREKDISMNAKASKYINAANKDVKNSQSIKCTKNRSNYNIDTQQFIDDVNTFYDSQIKLYQQKYDKKVAEYKKKNWSQSDGDSPFKDFLQRIQSCKQDKASFNKQVQQNCKHGDQIFTLANVVNNEAGTSNSKAKEAIAYAYLNMTGGTVREPKGAEISHYEKLNTRFSGMTDSDKYAFLPNFTQSMEAAGKRLSDSNPTANDPTSGADHWVSPSGLPKSSKTGYYLRKKYGTYFPDWARANNDPQTNKYIKDGTFKKTYKEFSINGVDDGDFLFYIGVK